jgi:predicted ATPase/DNA-binding winged helix-turn-helix (wHTH) protein
MEAHQHDGQCFTFGCFRIFPRARRLLASGEPLELGSRAFDLLLVLIEGHGNVLSKDALMARVWPDRVVEENNLQSHISALRKAFGPERELIRTVAGRGYQFTGEVGILSGGLDERADAETSAGEPPAALPLTNLPEPVSELIGRDDDLQKLVKLAASHRLVTLTGAGGIGKTRLALALARQRLPQFAEGVWLADLSPLTDPGLVPATVAAVLGLEFDTGEISAQRVVQELAERRLLLVLDTCEHVIGAAAAMAEALLHAGSDAHIIVTSREPLRAEGEQIYPVPPLAVPTQDAGAADDLQRYSAVRLFVERLCAAEPHFAPDRRLATMIAAICRRLDGIPLAIELAAARAVALGVEELAARLDDRFQLLTGGRRTAVPRHQSLQATHDWSYELLTLSERAVLRRLAVFRGAFGLDAIERLAAECGLMHNLIDDLANLVAKSLISVELEGPLPRYRVSETIRAYAREKLIESGEPAAIAGSQPEHVRKEAKVAWEHRPSIERLSTRRAAPERYGCRSLAMPTLAGGPNSDAA